MQRLPLRKGEIEDAVSLTARVFRFDLGEVLLQVIERLLVLIPTSNVGAQLLEFLDLGRNGLVIVRVLDVLRCSLMELGKVHLRACITDDLDIPGQEVIAVETEEGGECLTMCALR